MSRLYIFELDQVYVFNLKNYLQWNKYQFYIQNTRLIIKNNNKKYEVDEQKFYDLEGKFKCIWTNKKMIWNLMTLKDPLFIGRDSSCDIFWDYKTISSIHAKLSPKDILYDQNSTNGTFVNGKRVQYKKIEPTDHIVIYPIEIYIFHNFCITNAKVKQNNQRIECDDSFCSCSCMQSGKPFQVLPYQELVFDIESPKLLEEPCKQGWFQTFGSSIMMVFSTFVSILILFQVQNIKLEHILTTMISSTSMSISFLLFGWIQRTIHFKNQIKNYKRQENQYVDYLASCKNHIEHAYKEYEEIQGKEYAYIFDFTNDSFRSQSNFQLGIGLQTWTYVIFKIQTKSYTEKLHPWFKLQEQWIQKQKKTIQMNCWFSEGQKLWICGEYEKEAIAFLFYQWAWKLADEQHKWIWLVESEKMHMPWLDLYCCKIQETLLWFTSIEELEAQKLDAQRYIFTVFSTKDIELPWKASLIIFTESEVQTCDQVILKQALFQSEKYKRIHRQLCFEGDILQNQQEIFFDSICLFQGRKFNIQKVWEGPSQYRILAGMDAKERPIYFDLTEHGQGPHVLIAGMTGSGKSQWMMHMLLQLALYNAPQDLQYILVDFKGGAFGQYFYKFPHCAGYLTNLEGHSIERFTTLLQAEIEKRQKLLQIMIAQDRKQQAHIDSYNLKYPNNRLSHLFLIIDEFAQLKTQYPDFMQTLKEMARIGRSLGIHLILCTQKPMGIIDEQIWSNSKLKICFQVNSEADSQEILHDKRAAYIQNAGSFIAQVSSQEVFYEGQGLWLHIPYEQEMWHVHTKQTTRQQKKETLFEIYIQMIEQMKCKMHKIILDPIQNYLVRNHFLCVDDCLHGQQIEVDFQKNDKVLVLYKSHACLQRWIQSILIYYQNQVIGMDQNEIWNMYVDTNDYQQSWDIWIHFNSWKLKYHSLQIVMIDDIRLLPCEDYHAFTWHICLEPMSKDTYRTFFQKYHIQSLPFYEYAGWLRYKDQLMAFTYAHSLKSASCIMKRPYIFDQEKLWIGYDQESHQHLFWSQDRVLLICYVQKSQKEKIDDLIYEWKSVDPYLKEGLSYDGMCDFYVLYMPEHITFFQSEQYTQIQYDVDVLWIGLGLQEYAYFLHKDYIHTSKMIYWEHGKMHVIQDTKEG